LSLCEVCDGVDCGFVMIVVAGGIHWVSACAGVW
jgi:hypothetical protein